jgi:hypothetical protein
MGLFHFLFIVLVHLFNMILFKCNNSFYRTHIIKIQASLICLILICPQKLTVLVKRYTVSLLLQASVYKEAVNRKPMRNFVCNILVLNVCTVDLITVYVVKPLDNYWLSFTRSCYSPSHRVLDCLLSPSIDVSLVR